MTDDEAKKALRAGRPAAADYEVGYARPPKATRFKPGVSGNPRGRPKGSRNRPALHEERLKDIVLDEAYRTIQVRDGDRNVTIPIAQAVIRSLAVNAAKGRARSQELFTELLAATERANRRLHDEWLETAITYKVEWERELERRRAFGVTGPAPLPHPDDIVIDMRTGQVQIRGPMTREDQSAWDALRARKRECMQELEDLRALLTEDPDRPDRARIEEDIEHEARMLEMICKVIPD